MDVQKIIESKDNLILFLKEKGLEEEKDYMDDEYKDGTYFKIDKRKLLVIYEVQNEADLKEVKNHFLVDRGLSHCILIFNRKLIFFRNFGERKHFIYSERTKNKVSKIDRLRKIDEEGFDFIFQAGKDISGLFYESFKLKRNLLASSIKNDVAPTEKYLISQKIFDRIFFIYFLCHKGIIKFEDGRELSGKNLFNEILLNNGDFLGNLKKLFDLFNSQETDIFEVGDYRIVIPYLNGGLFRPDVLEQDLKISLKNEQWEEIFGFLNSYHWIIEDVKAIEDDEDKILTPEILGHVYERSVVEWEQKGFDEEAENAVQKITERKKKGVYYTPETITDYISNNTIKPYLLDRLGNKYKDIDELIESKNKTDIKKAIEILNDIKVLDPACGSGAFLIKASEVLFGLKRRLYYELGEKKNFYDLKLDTITENIYGVDILQGAIEIAKLRLWLWLISDFEESKNKIKALPNIEYNLKVGNSLIGWLDEKLVQIPLNTPLTDKVDGIFTGLIAFSESEEYKDLKKARELLRRYDLNGYIEAYYLLYKIYRRAHGLKAENLRSILETIRESIYSTVTPAFLVYVNSKIKPKYDPKNPPISNEEFDKLYPFHWRIDFGYIMLNGGFDVVLSNPPYVGKHSRENSSSASQLVWYLNYETAFKDSDVYCYFFERSNHLVSNSGYITMITSNTFFVSVFGSPLRALLSLKDIKYIIDFKEYQIFEDASNYVTIISYKNDFPSENNRFLCAKPLFNNPNTLDNNFSQELGKIDDELRTKFSGNNKIKKKLSAFEYAQSNLIEKTLLENGALKKIEYTTTKTVRIKKHVPHADIWVLLPPDVFELHNKLDGSSKTRLSACEAIRENKLIEFSTHISEGIFVGIQTSADDVYILKSIEDIDLGNWSAKKKIKVAPQRNPDEVFEIETGILKAFIKPNMLNVYSFNWEKTFVVFPYDEDGSLLHPSEIKRQYPLMWQYFTSKKVLTRMIETSKDRLKLIEKLIGKLNVKNIEGLSNYLSKNSIDNLPEEFWWYKYIYPKNLVSVNKPKILTKTVANKNSFSLDIHGTVAPHNVGVYSIPLKRDFYYILGLLNSKVCQFYLTSFLPDKRGGYFLYIKDYLSRVPVPIITRTGDVEALVKQILQSKTKQSEVKQLQNEIDQLVYKIYGLTEDEIKIVEGFND